MKRLFTDKIENMRDIGGYSIDNNKVVKTGSLVRTNVITNFSEDDIKNIADMGFSTVIDLRSDKEIERKNGVFVNNAKFSYKHVPIKGDGRLPNENESVLDTYIEMLSGKDQIKEIFDILSKTEGGVIYYCNAGKDRTGVVTALILKLLGVDEKEIAVDYAASGIFLDKMLKDYAKSMNNNKNIINIITPKADTIFKLYDYIDENYGSTEEYLKQCGITENTINTIKEKYITTVDK